jgi:hypothetical protein
MTGLELNVSALKKSHRHSSQQQQLGAVWSEFIVSASFMLIGFFLLIPLFAKVIDVRQKSEMAARYSTWERTVWFQNAPGYFPNQAMEKSNTEVEAEMEYRIFAQRNQVIDSQSQRSKPSSLEYDAFLNFQNRSNDTYQTVLKPDGSELTTLNQTEGGSPGSFGPVINTAINLLSPFGDSRFNTDGYYSGDVSVPIKQFAWIEEFDGVTPVFSSRGAILADAWNTDKGLAEDRGVSLMYRDQLEASGALSVIEAAQSIGGLFLADIKPSNLKLFEVDVDAVPVVRTTDPEN